MEAEVVVLGHELVAVTPIEGPSSMHHCEFTHFISKQAPQIAPPSKRVVLSAVFLLHILA